MRKLAKQKIFASEAELCARFISKIGDEWVAYPETQGWDILLVRKADGFQIGIQAKLAFNVHVLNQTIESSYANADAAGPDCRAILVPENKGGLGTLAAYVGITVIAVRSPPSHGYMDHYAFEPRLPNKKDLWSGDKYWHEWCPTKRHKLPEYVPDVAAGASAPTQLTDWKIKAIKIAVLLEKRGHVTRSDFKAIGIDHRRWLAPNNWLGIENGLYIAARLPDFKKQHPKNYAEIEADFSKWAPAAFQFGEQVGVLI